MLKTVMQKHNINSVLHTCAVKAWSDMMRRGWNGSQKQEIKVALRLKMS